MGLIGVRADRLAERDPVLRGGMAGYLLPFEIISIHLVVVLVGAAYLARARRRVQSSGVRVQGSEAALRPMLDPDLASPNPEP